MSAVFTAGMSAEIIAAAEIAAAAEAAAAAAAAAEATAATTALAAEAVPIIAEAAPVLTEAASVAPEAGSILEASAMPPPPAEPLPPAGLEQLPSAGQPPAPTLDYVEPAVTPAQTPQPAPTPQGQPQMQQAQYSIQNNAPSQTGPTFNTEVRPGMELTDTGFQPAPEGMQQPSGLEQIKTAPGSGPSPSPAPGQGGTLNANGTVTMPDGSTVPWEQYSQSQGFDPSIKPPGTETPNPFLQGAKDTLEWMDKNPFKTGAAAYMGLQATGMLNQKSSAGAAPQPKKFSNQYSLSPNFQGGPYSEPNVYKPRYATGGITQINPGPVQQMSQNVMGGQGNMYPQSQQEHTNFATPTQMPASAEVIRADYDTKTNPYSGVMMASGGVARFADEGEVEEDKRPTRRYRGDLMGTLDKYNTMITGKPASMPSGKADPYTGATGIVEDTDTDTRYQDAFTAAQTRLKKAGQRANVDVAALPTGIKAGTLSMPTRQGANGGIMQASLGSYASGGNPRLLKGPGDGMSDNIPATIGGKQPARLADGEFVVPADVVSHLGNGSTEAGAKKLHQMMDKIRMDRTGKKKQAPAVKAGKYIPK
jgi:hypothetical protein